VPAVERDDRWSLVQKLREADELPGLVRQKELRHRLAGFRRRDTDAVVREPRHHPVDDVGEFRAQPPHFIRHCLQTQA
jgi:hypothetical protein